MSNRVNKEIWEKGSSDVFDVSSVLVDLALLRLKTSHATRTVWPTEYTNTFSKVQIGT
jgi:hypothetical protein